MEKRSFRHLATPRHLGICAEEHTCLGGLLGISYHCTKYTAEYYYNSWHLLSIFNKPNIVIRAFHIPSVLHHNFGM